MSTTVAPDGADSKAIKRPPRTLAAFESIPFRWLVGSLSAFFLAMQGQMLVRSLLAWNLTHSELSLAYVNLVVAVPMLLGSFIAGAVIDRVERRRLLIIGQLIIMLNECIVLLLLASGHLLYWHLLVTSFIMGVTFPFIMPTRTAMVYSLVGRDKLGNAMALQAGTMNVARLVGPAVIGLLIPLISLSGAYVCAISLYLVSTLTMLKVPPSPPAAGQQKSLLKDVQYSFVYIARHREILLCVLFGLFPLLLVLPIINFLVVFTEEVWQKGEVGLGMLTATVGAGGIIGSVIVAKLGDKVRRARLMMLSAICFAIILAAFCEAPWFILALVLLLAGNILFDISQVLNQTIVQLLAHEEVRGRMSSLVMLSIGLTPLGVLPIALLAEHFGIANTMFSACSLLLLILLGFYFFSPTLRRLDQAIAVRDQETQAGEI